MLRFLVLGGANTLITTALFVLLMLRIPYAAAYVVSFGTGLVLNALLVGRFVFRAPSSARTSARVACWSLLMMSTGAGMSALAELRELSPLATAAGVALVVVPVNFLGSRFIVAHGARRTGSDVRHEARSAV